MDVMKWLKNSQWLRIVGTQRAYKGMIMRGDPDSKDDVAMSGQPRNVLASFQDQARESHRGVEVADLADAQVVTSETTANPFKHKVLLDIDHEAMLIPSTTPGHYHLLIDVEVPWEKYVDMMDAMAEAGVIEAGFAKAARKRGFSTLRMPWVKKENPTERTENSHLLPEWAQHRDQRAGESVPAPIVDEIQELGPPHGIGTAADEWLNAINAGDLAIADQLVQRMEDDLQELIRQRRGAFPQHPLVNEEDGERFANQNDNPFGLY